MSRRFHCSVVTFQGSAGIWLLRQPEAFHVHRRYGTGELLALWPGRFEHLEEDETTVDRAVTTAWEPTRATDPLRRGEHLEMARFQVHGEVYHRPLPGLGFGPYAYGFRCYRRALRMVLSCHGEPGILKAVDGVHGYVQGGRNAISRKAVLCVGLARLTHDMVSAVG